MRVLLTGGSGFLSRGIIRWWPENEYTIFSRDEYKQDMARVVLQRVCPLDSVYKTSWLLGDICDREALLHAMHNIDLVVHTAAVKYIPEAELNVAECVRVNVEGSRNVISCALAVGVKRVVGISTDKAVQPLNVYGMTKALMERLFVEANRYGTTVFTCTRYGNVVGSTGSVFTVFERQLEQQGCITVTDSNMTRFWQSISQSVELVRVAAQSAPGHIVIPQGHSMEIGQLARYMTNQRDPSLKPDNIEVVGARPGEKMHETLIGEHESQRVIRQGNYYHLVPQGNQLDSRSTVVFTSDKADSVTFEQMDQMMEEARCISY